MKALVTVRRVSTAQIEVEVDDIDQAWDDDIWQTATLPIFGTPAYEALWLTYSTSVEDVMELVPHPMVGQ